MIKKVKISKLLFLTAYALYIIRAGIEGTTFMSFFENYSITRPITFVIGFFLIGIKILFYDRKFDRKALCYVIVIAILFLIEFYFTSYFELMYLLLLIIGLKSIDIKNIVKLHFCVYLSITVIAALASWTGIIENYITVNSSGIYRAAWGNTYPTDFAAGLFYLMLDYVYLNFKKIRTFQLLWLLLIIVLSYHVTHSQTSLILGIFLLVQLIVVKSKKASYIFSTGIYNNIIAWSFPVIAFISIYLQYIFKNNGYNNSILLTLNSIMNYRLGFGSRAIQQYGLSLFGKRIVFYGAGWGTSGIEDYFYVDNAYLQYALIYGLLLTTIFIVGYYLLCKHYRHIDNRIIMIIIFSCLSVSAISEPRIFNILYNPFFLGQGVLLWKHSIIGKEVKYRRLMMRRN